MIKKYILLFCMIQTGFMCFISPMVKAEVSKEIEAQAIEASLLWLSVVDQGLYEQSWMAASEKFQELVPKTDWLAKMNSFRKPLGQVKSREVLDKGYFGAIPNHPGMEMFVIQFKVSYEFKETAVETISPVRFNGGPWKVSGYYISDSIDVKVQ